MWQSPWASSLMFHCVALHMQKLFNGCGLCIGVDDFPESQAGIGTLCFLCQCCQRNVLLARIPQGEHS